MSTKERMNEARDLLKAAGFNRTHVTLRHTNGGSVIATIRKKGVPATFVDRIVRDACENYQRCEATGEILSGGNTFVSVSIDDTALTDSMALAKSMLDAADASPGTYCAARRGVAAIRFAGGNGYGIQVVESSDERLLTLPHRERSETWPEWSGRGAVETALAHELFERTALVVHPECFETEEPEDLEEHPEEDAPTCGAAHLEALDEAWLCPACGKLNASTDEECPDCCGVSEPPPRFEPPALRVVHDATKGEAAPKADPDMDDPAKRLLVTREIQLAVAQLRNLAPIAHAVDEGTMRSMLAIHGEAFQSAPGVALSIVCEALDGLPDEHAPALVTRVAPLWLEACRA